MLIRLLGREAEAKALANEACVFTDIPDWGIGYANFAYAMPDTRFGSHLFGAADKMDALSYTTFMLRTLGYSDSSGEFTYDASIEFAEQIGTLFRGRCRRTQKQTFFERSCCQSKCASAGNKNEKRQRLIAGYIGS